MEIGSFKEELIFNDKHVTTTVILESDFSKEIRIAFKKGQVMKKHKTRFPIVVQVLSGAIDFNVNESIQYLKEGGIIALEANIPHDLTAREESVVRLTLSKLDKAERLEKVIDASVN